MNVLKSGVLILAVLLVVSMLWGCGEKSADANPESPGGQATDGEDPAKPGEDDAQDLPKMDDEAKEQLKTIGYT